MKILLLTHSYPDKINSWRGSFIKEQAEALSMNHNVIVVYFSIDYEHFAPFSPYSFSKIQTGNLTEYTVTIKKFFPVVNQVNYLLKTYRFIDKEILQYEKPDLINSHLSYPAGFLGTIIQKKKKIPNFITEHSRIASYFRSWFHKRCVIYALRNTSCIIPVSISLKTEILGFSNRPLNVIYNIVDTRQFHFNPSKVLNILNIGFLGGLGNNNKGLDILLAAVYLLKNKNVILHIGGKGSLSDAYKAMSRKLGIDGLCKFYGEIPRTDISDFYSKLDLFVLPSRYETFGIVLIEAMASGLPVIATKCGGPQEIVSPETGMLIEKNNSEELAEAISTISKNLYQYNKVVIRSYAEEKFGQSAFIERITSLYQDVLKKN